LLRDDAPEAWQGVGLARWSLALDELAAGRLVMPFPKAKPLATGPAYYLAASRLSLQRPSVRAFRDWLVAEAVESLRIHRS
jgi:LysR family transcriptional regulator, glycine cleavage system transcriptional activator